MAIYGRINDVSPLKGFNGYEFSYQSIQLPSWLEEKDKKNFLRFYYMLRYGIEIGDNNILATQVYDEGKSKNIILYSGLCSEKPNSIHVESNNILLVPAIRTSNSSIIDTNVASYNYGVRLSISDANENFGTCARVHLDILNGFNSILGYANSLGFNIKFILSINDNNYGDLYASTQYNIMSSSRVIDTGKHNLDQRSETHTIKFNYIKVLLIGNNSTTTRSIACVSSFENNEPFMYRDIRDGPWNGSGLWSSDSHSEDETRNLIFSNADFNWDF